MKLVLQKLFESKIWLRKGTHGLSSDEQAVDEVLVKKAYRRVKDGFDVCPGERWLDLGANVGAFAIYCREHGATAVCYEPEPECFKILLRNAPGFMCFPYAVTASQDIELPFVKSKNPENNYRGTVLPVASYQPHSPVLNYFAGQLIKERFDGVKMDIEGSEFGLIDNWFLPRCQKLVLEYHTSRDASFENLQRRLEVLESHFKNVKRPACFETGKGFPPRFDQKIFCWGER